MNIAEYTIRKAVVAWVATLLVLAGGWLAYERLGRFEDPEFVIRQAVEEVFKVKVVKVSTIYVRPKPKRMGAFLGKSRSWKKAVVTVAAGERIEFFEGANA